LYGVVFLDKRNSTQIIVAKVIDNTSKKAWYFYEFLLPDYPISSFLINPSQAPVFEPHVSSGNSYSLSGEGSRTISRYTSEFPAAAPPFSEGLARVTSVIKADSVFTVSAHQSVKYDENGLYLVQRDTSSKDGFAFRVYDDYPKYARLENLAGPLIYVCTKQEIEKIKDARGEKKVFDRVILSITGNAERAKTFMRNYFGRVELANQYFSSYKEGWKSDRGMVFIIFGLPDELYRFSDREVWEYKGEDYKITFDFVRSPTLFDPDNFVLIRKKKFQETWSQIIDQWRNARF
jgi:GWxTD domain-containing protein